MSAQVTGRLTGSVVDASGAAITGATVDLRLPGGDTPLLHGSTTSEGLFSFSGVRPASYDLAIGATGFIRSVIRGIKVDPARETAIPAVKLEIEAVTQTLEVSAAPEAVQTGNIEISTTITRRQVETLPVLDRQVSMLFLTQPGVTSGRGPTVVNGLRTSMANVTLDGINVQDNFIRSNALDYIPAKFTIEQVAELTVTTSNANSATGGGAAQMVMVTRSGDNSFHGSAYWYNRNSALSANDWFNNKSGLDVPFLNQNQLGGSLGGPVKKDKLFFYFNYEAFRLRRQKPVTRTILTPAARGGVFTYRDAGGTLQTANLPALKNFTADPAMQALVGQVPAAGNSTELGDGLNTTGYRFNARYNESRDAVTGKLDYVLSTRHTLSGTYIWNTDLLDRPDLANDFNAVPPVWNDNHSRLVTAAWRWNPLPSLTNELRGGFNLAPGDFRVKDKYPSYFVSGLLFSNPVNTYLAQGRATDTYHYQDNANLLKGRHNLYFGFQAQLIRTAPYNDAATYGIVPTYVSGIPMTMQGLTAAELPGVRSSDLNTANNLYANLAGLVSGYNQSFNVKDRSSGFVNGYTNIRHFTYDNYAGYVQDNVKLRPRLTLNLGLRYEYFTPLDERDGLMLLPQVAGGNFIGTLMSNATLDFAGGPTGRPFYNADRNNFAPNVGFAWDLSGNGKTAIRGGYSISYVTDDSITTIRNNVNTNAGLVGNSASTRADGRLTGGLPAIPTPVYQVPRTFADNYNADPNTAFGLPDPGLRTPYVQQYSFGIQQEIKGTIVEARYVGNHGVKELRAFDYNQVVIRENGFLEDFNRARNNGFAAMRAGQAFDPRYNSAIPGSQPLALFPEMPNGGYLTNASVVSYIRQGEPGTLGQFYQANLINGPVNFFRNPYALGTNSVASYSNSSYNAFQLDVRRHNSRGLYYQFNYTFSKVLGDGSGDNQARFEPFLDNNNPGIERSRAPFDLTHVFKANFAYELPLGAGKRLAAGPVLNRILGGWTVSGMWTYESGTPFSVLSQRGTLNRGARSTNNTAVTALNGGQLEQAVGFYMTGNGPYFVNPAAGGPIGPDGRGVSSDGSTPFAGQVFFNPGAGEIGTLQRRYFSGPWDFLLDASVVKRIPITERQYLELHAESFNMPNHPAFWVGDESTSATRFNINQPSFGKITGTFNSSRRMQFGLYYRF